MELNPEKWIVNYGPYLNNYAATKIKDPLLVQDLVQETFLAALKSRKLFKGSASERTWLTSILRNKIIDYYRTTNTQKGKAIRASISHTEYLSKYHKEATADTIENNSTNRYLYFTELEEILEEGIKILGKKEADAFHLKIIGHDTEYICEELKISRVNCWVILCRARQKLRSYLNNEWQMVS